MTDMLLDVEVLGVTCRDMAHLVAKVKRTCLYDCLTALDTTPGRECFWSEREPTGLSVTLSTAGITAPGTNVYPNPKKPVFGSPINWNRALSTGLVSALPLNEGDGTSFNDAVTQQPCLARRLSGTASTASAEPWHRY